MNSSSGELFPLNETLRPANLKQYLGQEHLVGEGKIIHSLIRHKRLNSIIFWGPPGTGKTTLSRILVRELHYPSRECSATIASITQIRKFLQEAQKLRELEGNPLVLFVDEIHHFNKHSQDTFLPYVERGDIILLGTTIENPAYKINRALLSRIRILELYPLKDCHLKTILERAVTFLKKQTGRSLDLPRPVVNILLNHAQGDCRRILNLVEILFHLGAGKITPDRVREIIQKNIGAYDRSGQDRYHLISAFHKSVRNSDTDAALFWLYRMLEGGEDPLFILRRMIRIASEDVGFADPQALTVTLQAREAFDFLGLPEGSIFLAQAAIYLACAPKSNSLYRTEKRMEQLAKKYRHLPVPAHLLNPSNFVDRKKGAGKGYRYAHDYPQKTTAMQTLPEGVSEKGFFEPNAMGFEKKIRERLEFWEKVKRQFSKKS